MNLVHICNYDTLNRFHCTCFSQYNNTTRGNNLQALNKTETAKLWIISGRRPYTMPSRQSVCMLYIVIERLSKRQCRYWKQDEKLHPQATFIIAKCTHTPPPCIDSHFLTLFYRLVKVTHLINFSLKTYG